MNKERAQRAADWAAEDCHRNHFDSRRGVFHMDNLDCLVVYNNNPYQADASIRPWEMSELEKRLEAVGISTLARGQAGPVIDDAGQRYTMTLLLDCSADKMSEVCDIGEPVFAKGSSDAEMIWRSQKE